MLRLADYAGKPLTRQPKKNAHYSSTTNPAAQHHENVDDSVYELLHGTEGSFAGFARNVGKEEDRWSVNVGWKKATFSATYAFSECEGEGEGDGEGEV